MFIPPYMMPIPPIHNPTKAQTIIIVGSVSSVFCFYTYIIKKYIMMIQVLD